MSDYPNTEELERIIASWPKPERAILNTLKGEELPDLEPSERRQYLQLLIRHRLLVRHVKSLASKYPNTPIAKKGQALKEVYVKHQLTLSAQILKLGKLFNEVGIRYVALKGPILSEMIYGQVSQRQSTDIDILIDKADVKSSVHMLRTAGFDCVENIEELDEKYFETYLALTDEVTLISKTLNRVKIDLHWKITTPLELFPVLDKPLWEYTDTYDFNGLEVRVISPELNFIYLCLHGAKHKWFRLQWLMDISELFQHQLDWDSIVQIVEKNQISRSVCQAAVLSSVLSKSRIPSSINQLVDRNPEASHLAHMALEAIYKEESFMSAFDRRNLNHLTRNLMALKKGIRFKYVCLKRFLISSKDWETIRLPPQLIWLYIPLRPLLFWVRK